MKLSLDDKINREMILNMYEKLLTQIEGLNTKEKAVSLFEKISAQIERLTAEVNSLKNGSKNNTKNNKKFGLEVLKNSRPLTFVKDIQGVGTPTKDYLLSTRISDEWKGRKGDLLFTVRQQEKENQENLKSLGIRVPITDLKKLKLLTQQIITILFIGCEIKGANVSEMLRDILMEINTHREEIMEEIKQKLPNI